MMKLDVIEVGQNNTENGVDETPEDCDHFAHEIDTDWTTWHYCPKCGERL